MDVNAVYHSPEAIKTLFDSGILSHIAAKKAKQTALKKISEAIEWALEKGFLDVVDGLNKSYISCQKMELKK